MKEYPYIRLTYFDNKGQKRYRYAPKTRSRRIVSLLASAKTPHFVILVQYGIHEDCFGKKVMFDNEAECFNRRDAKGVLRDFLEIKPEELG